MNSLHTLTTEDALYDCSSSAGLQKISQNFVVLTSFQMTLREHIATKEPEELLLQPFLQKHMLDISYCYWPG
jgi:hypothetical protein